MILDQCPFPIVLAPLAGGPSTPELAAAVSEAGGLGFLAAGYLTAEALRDRLVATRRLTARPFGLNLFVPSAPGDTQAIARYAATLADEAARAGVGLGEPRHDDDDWEAKLGMLAADPVPVVSFTFGLPGRDVVAALHRTGTEVWITVNSPAQAAAALDRGADVLVLQGIEAGGHQGGLADPSPGLGLLALLQLVHALTDAPLVASGGIATGAAVAAVLAAGAQAAALGTAFLTCPEAGTAAVHRQALHGTGATALTRAFSGRTARGIVNRFMTQHPGAPPAYPEIHNVTTPLRQAARAAGNPEIVNLWAGQAYPLATGLPAAQLVRQLAGQARDAAAALTSRLHRRWDCLPGVSPSTRWAAAKRPG
jgi:nitronate monooxygenase